MALHLTDRVADRRLAHRGRIAVVAATALLGTTAMGWGRSGSVARNPYRLTESTLRLGLVDGWSGTILQWSWALVPVAVGAMWLGWVLSRWVVVRILGGVVATVVLGTAWAVWRSPLVPTTGLVLGATAGVVLAVAVFVPIPRQVALPDSEAGAPT